MNCKTVEILMYNYIDNELTEQECIEIEEHLKTCKSCKNLYLYESEFNNTIKQELQKENIKAPEDLKDRILNGKKHYSINHDFFTLQKISSVAAVLIFAVFISKFTMGYSTISENYEKSLKKEIKIASNNEKKLSEWIKKHNYKNFKLIKFKKNTVINPLGLAFHKNSPIMMYHYKGYKLAYRNIKAMNKNLNYKKLNIKGKTYYLTENSGIHTAFWENGTGNMSVLTSDLPENQFKTLLYSIKE